ncbi:MAG: hypothetical protein K2J71_04865 [Oscillospiraceae bacterium]|nr:hypothetical protein [Oscillospiraceae bacterium]
MLSGQPELVAVLCTSRLPLRWQFLYAGVPKISWGTLVEVVNKKSVRRFAQEKSKTNKTRGKTMLVLYDF